MRTGHLEIGLRVEASHRSRRYAVLAGAGLLIVAYVAAPPRVYSLEAPRACFRSVAEAAGNGPALRPDKDMSGEAQGFRLAKLERDPFSGRTWARVTSCAHPEWPAAIVAAGHALAAQAHQPEAPAHAPSSSPATLISDGTNVANVKPDAPIVHAGSVLHVFRTEQNVRVAFEGVAQTNGALGDRIRVRVLGSLPGAGAQEQFVAGVVRGADTLEMEP